MRKNPTVCVDASSVDKIHSSNVGGIDIPPTFEVTTQLLINHKVCKQKSTLVQWFCVIAVDVTDVRRSPYRHCDFKVSHAKKESPPKQSPTNYDQRQTRLLRSLISFLTKKSSPRNDVRGFISESLPFENNTKKY